MRTKKILLILFIFFLAFSLAAFFQISKTQAGPGNNASGWLWGGSDDGAGNSTGLGWISLNNTNTSGATDFGLDIPAAGDFAGPGYHAWSSNVGWVSFRATDLAGCPTAPCTARRVGNNLKGWARVLGIKTAFEAGASGGWAGWIKLGTDGTEPPGTPTYGITLNADGTITKNPNTSYAWSNELGWIDFSRATTAATGTDQLLICPSNPIILDKGGYSDLNAYFWSNFVGVANCSSPAPTDVTNLSTWGTSDPSVATINASAVLGRVTGVKVGTSNITAQYNALNANTTANIIATPCLSDPSCAADTCLGQMCDDGCGNITVPGTKSCINSGNWIEVAP